MQDNVNYTIYKNTKNQCFVKYPDQSEKEIPQHEYDELLEFKNRMLDAKIKEPIIYEQKEKEYSILAFYDESEKKPIKYDPSVDEFGAHNWFYESCKGKYYITENSFVINSVSNESKGNGAFTELINLVKRIMKQQYLVIENIYNPNLILNLEKSHGFKKISNTVCIWSK